MISDEERAKSIVLGRIAKDDAQMSTDWDTFKTQLPDKFKDWPPDHILLVRSVFEIGWMMGMEHMALHPHEWTQ